MHSYSGSCLCGSVTYKGEAEQFPAMNCHCTDCRKYSGAAYTTNIFVPASSFSVRGELMSYEHKSDRGSDMVKFNCSACGSAIYGTNSGREGTVTLRAGTIDQTELVKPGGYVFCDSAIPSTAMDSELKKFARMPS